MICFFIYFLKGIENIFKNRKKEKKTSVFLWADLDLVRGWADGRIGQTLKKILHREFPGGIGLHAFTAEGAGSTPGWGTKIP